jgi:deazaflavin-dependent oxidoreductase (nitroreductase family)
MALSGMGRLAAEQYCYLTTVGRVTGNPHTIEIWFAAAGDGSTLYMLSGGRDRSDWVKNIGRNPRVRVRIDGQTFAGNARLVEAEPEDREARRLVVKKYYGRDRVNSIGWEAESLAVAVDLDGPAG